MEGELIGKVLNGSSIAVDYFDEDVKNGMYFLTEGNLKFPLPPYVDRVYTSPYNARLLQAKFQIDSDVIVGLDMYKKLLIQDNTKNLDFHVTLLEAKQRPGAVMFLFEGNRIGNILYAGKCCYSEDIFSRPLCSFLKTKVLDFLYIHDACEDCHIHSKSYASAVDEICEIARLNPNHKVFIVEPCLREDILKCLKDKLKSTISVTENIMKHLEDVGEGPDFTLSYKGVQVVVTENPQEKWRIGNVPVQKIILVPCSSKNTCAKLKESKSKGYCVLFYKNHCSRPELQSLVRDLSAKHTVLIRPLLQESNVRVFTHKIDLDYWSHLGDVDQCLAFFDKSQGITDETESIFDNELITCYEKKAQCYSLDVFSDNSDEFKLEDSTLKEGQQEHMNIWLGSDSESSEFQMID